MHLRFRCSSVGYEAAEKPCVEQETVTTGAEAR